MVSEAVPIRLVPVAHPADERLRFRWFAAYLGFIAYGSLLPFEFRPIDLADGWHRFLQAPMFQLGIESRADWIANGILYIPAGFLLGERFVGRLCGFAFAAALVTGTLSILAFAFGIEFAQVFFPPRTVSQNDLLAESVGTLIGVFSALRFSNHIRHIAAYRAGSGHEGMSLLLSAYMLAYVAYSLFPYDFLLSPSEISAKASSSGWGVLIAESAGTSVLRTSAGLGIEILTALPFGVYIALRFGSPARAREHFLAPLLGVAFGCAVEAAQFFIYSGISQGLSVATRAIGVTAGAAWTRYAQPALFDVALKGLRDKAQSFGLAYACVLVAIFAMANQPWGNANDVLAALRDVRLLPFYYHYFTTEAIALRSLISVAILYVPLGVLAWAQGHGTRPWMLVGGAASVAVEATRLPSILTHPDPSNVLIALATIALIHDGLQRIFTTNHVTKVLPKVLPQPQACSARAIVGLPAVSFATAVWLLDFPVYSIQLGLLYFFSAIVVWHKPAFSAFLIPAALPMLDLAPWSGRFFLDEFDFLVATVLVTAIARSSPAHQSPGRLITIAASLLSFSFIVSTALALVPWPASNPTSFTSYLSPFNALRIVKGFLLAMLFAGVMRRLNVAGADTDRHFGMGMIVGLIFTVLVVLREKALFGGVLNFDFDYRATGPFSAINTGGAFIECYIVVALPFLLYFLITTKSWLVRFGCFAVLLGTTYAVMATVSRSGYAAFSVACIIMLFAALRESSGRGKRAMYITIVLAGSLGIAVPLFQGKFVQQRFETILQDLQIRAAHWRDGLAMRDSDLLNDMLGMGVGTYPSTHYWKSRESHHASAHGIATEEENRFLRIAPGNTLYVEQIVHVEPQRRYRLRLDIRSAAQGTEVGIALCEKWLIASARCATWQHSPKTVTRDEWLPFETWIESKDLGSGTWPAQRPVKLSIFATSPATIDVDNVHLLDAAGNDIVKNGDFTRSIDHWFFATDEHLAWHIKNMPLAILFDQGWIGLLAFVFFVITCSSPVALAALRGNMKSAAYLAASSGFLMVGLFDSLIDAPRFLFLFLLLQLVPISAPPTLLKRERTGNQGLA